MKCIPHMSMIVIFSSIIILTSCNQVNGNQTFCSKNKGGNTVFCQDFEKSPIGKYTIKSLADDWLNVIKLSSSGIRHHGISQERVSVINKASNRALEVFYPKETFGSVDSGATWIMQLPKSYENLKLEYKVMFSENFFFSKEKLGGKLPGLSGGKSNSGGSIPTGKDGWSSRIMWGKDGRGLQYLYYPDMKDSEKNPDAFPHGIATSWFGNKYFTSIQNSQCISEWPRPAGSELKFKTNTQYVVTQEVTMNTINDENKGNNDGTAKVWVNGKLVVNCNNIRYRDTDALAIDYLFFSTFLGGGTFELSAHPVNETVEFDDFLLTVK